MIGSPGDVRNGCKIVAESVRENKEREVMFEGFEEENERSACLFACGTTGVNKCESPWGPTLS